MGFPHRQRPNTRSAIEQFYLVSHGGAYRNLNHLGRAKVNRFRAAQMSESPKQVVGLCERNMGRYHIMCSLVFFLQPQSWI